ncbi:MAG: type secretion system protein, partial [Deltaproteobacteria bacterium]|nr:type secretion system protein [Deltaproteobacteria bacterium]
MSTPERANGDRALLRFLARQGRISNDDVNRIEGMLEEPGVAVHDVLERESLIGQKDLALLLAETLRLRLVDLTTYPLDANVTRELKENIATRYEVIPIGIDARSIEVVTANPLDLDGLRAVEFATGKRVQAVVATHIEVMDALAHTYRLQESLEQFLQLVPTGESLVVSELSDDGGDLRSIAADAELPPVIKLADKMLIEGIKSRASDIHVEPETDSVLVRYRVDGILEEAFRFPKWIQNPLIARLKVMAKLDITERRLPQDGRIQVRYQDKSVDMRVSSLPAQHGEKITLRILDASQAVKVLERLGFAPGDLKLLRDAAKKPQGMILITGPTGSGKTTTLYALLREIFSPKTNIVTIENPIEYQLKGINQVEVN